MRRTSFLPTPPPWTVVLCSLGSLVLLSLSVFSTLSLEQGGTPARVCVAVLAAAMAGLCLMLLLREGYPLPVCLICMLPAAAGLFLRVLCLDSVTPDYQNFLAQWAAFFRTEGGFAALSEPVGNYNVPYLYFLAAISYIKVPDLYLIKLFSVLFDVLLAWGVLRLTRLFTPADSLRPLAGFCLTLLLPTVILNGACWAQCDSLYTALSVLAIAAALEERPKTSVVLLAIAFSFKLQAVFLLPLWCAFWFTRRVRFRELLLFPAIWLMTALPAVLAGRPLLDILSIYRGQMGVNNALTFNAPSVYGLLPYGLELNISLWARPGLAATFALVLAVLALLFLRRRQAGGEALFAAAVVLALGAPFFLPYMHERYFFSAGLLTLAWACVHARGVPAAAAMELASLSVYFVYFRQKFTFLPKIGGRYIPLLAETLLVLLALSLTWSALLKTLKKASSEKPDGTL